MQWSKFDKVGFISVICVGEHNEHLEVVLSHKEAGRAVLWLEFDF